MSRPFTVAVLVKDGVVIDEVEVSWPSFTKALVAVTVPAVVKAPRFAIVLAASVPAAACRAVPAFVKDVAVTVPPVWSNVPLLTIVGEVSVPAVASVPLFVVVGAATEPPAVIARIALFVTSEVAVIDPPAATASVPASTSVWPV